MTKHMGYLPSPRTNNKRAAVAGKDAFFNNVVPAVGDSQMVGTMDNGPGIQPSWSTKLHPSHDLCFGAGWVFCCACGCFVCSQRKCKLWESCSRRLVEADAVPLDIWRTARLKEGDIRMIHRSQWPDGRAGDTFISMHRVQR